MILEIVVTYSTFKLINLIQIIFIAMGLIMMFLAAISLGATAPETRLADALQRFIVKRSWLILILLLVSIVISTIIECCDFLIYFP